MVAQHVFYVKVKDSQAGLQRSEVEDEPREWEEIDVVYGEGEKSGKKVGGGGGGEAEERCCFVLYSLSLAPLLHGP